MNDNGIEQLIAEARGGSDAALGELIETVRTYLLLVANEETEASLRAKVAASDVVQDACLIAQQRFETFRGTTEAELRAWMRRVLLNSLSDSRRKYVFSEKRNASREVDAGEINMVSPELTPKSSLLAEEEARLLRSAMARLSEDHQTVLQLRNWELLPFSEIGQRMGRSEDAAQKLWSRAVRELEQHLIDMQSD